MASDTITGVGTIVAQAHREQFPQESTSLRHPDADEADSSRPAAKRRKERERSRVSRACDRCKAYYHHIPAKANFDSVMEQAKVAVLWEAPMSAVLTARGRVSLHCRISPRQTAVNRKREGNEYDELAARIDPRR